MDDARIEIPASIVEMLRALLISGLLAATLATALPASAQTDAAPSGSAPAADPRQDTLDQQLARWVHLLERVDGLPTHEGGET